MLQQSLSFVPVFDESYPEGFSEWLRLNQRIYSAFRSRALQMALRGRPRYSARTIVETIRWETDLREAEVTFKINDHFTPGMARLFMAEFGARFPRFFELRD